MKIGIGGDHAGFAYKQQVKQMLEEQGHEVRDFGPNSEESTDYPDYVHPLASAIESGEFQLGIAICGSGNGVCMTVNKHQNIRGALVWNTELAALARQHNNANVLVLGARILEQSVALGMVDVWLDGTFEGRHQARLDKVHALESIGSEG